ncbi:hypothetical protein KO493_10225 [Tamlana agarivorans]|uniref:Uncharacterized protein n=1 Tax=Pseudotamlana agarivorans TaxID=481183 RepID=A0ACC5U9T4_9FLAO|nr:bestrophin family ion channel [Tamlana agarivorans]MBU2951071.1 hypothetical protein [Tamlana agarivorans]
MTAIALTCHFEIVNFKVHWVPVSVIGTAVAFYVGFKNNQSYERLWEARKIWGGIINESRTWGMMVDGFVSNYFTNEKVSEEELKTIKRSLVYRHLAWVYTHRSQLLVTTTWEHASQGGHTGRRTKYLQKNYGVGLINDLTETELKLFLSEEEHDRLVKCKNTATQIINEQSRHLHELREKGLINDLRHVEMQKVLRSLYTLQGKNERIKKFPLPRQYANLSRYFVGIFIVLLPFSLIPEMFQTEGGWVKWLSIPVTALVGWVYVCMELVADYSANPFQGLATDIPMLSLCRTIEIDLREMLEETDLPPAIEAKKGVLM